MPKSHWSFCVSFSRTGAGLCIYHLFVWSNLNFLHISQWITLPTQYWEFFPPALTDGLLLDSGSPQVSRNLSQHSWSQQCCSLNGLVSFFDFQLFYLTQLLITVSSVPITMGINDDLSLEFDWKVSKTLLSILPDYFISCEFLLLSLSVGLSLLSKWQQVYRCSAKENLNPRSGKSWWTPKTMFH